MPVWRRAINAVFRSGTLEALDQETSQLTLLSPRLDGAFVRTAHTGEPVMDVRSRPEPPIGLVDVVGGSAEMPGHPCLMVSGSSCRAAVCSLQGGAPGPASGSRPEVDVALSPDFPGHWGQLPLPLQGGDRR